MIILDLIVAWYLLGIVAFAVYAARAGEYWAARRRYTAMLRIALSGKNRMEREMLRLRPKTPDNAVAMWQNGASREAGRWS